MKKFIFVFIPVLLLCAGCVAGKYGEERKNPLPYAGKKIKTALYIDKGSSGAGVLHIGRLLTYSPQIELAFVKGEDLRKGKLKNFELLVMPGGSSRQQMISMGEEGVKALQKFVHSGGAYVGICAGFHIMLNRPERAQLVPYTYIRKAVGYRGKVQIDLSGEGAKLLDVKAGKRFVQYSRGPIAKEAAWTKGTCRTYARYTSSVGPLGRAGISFFNTPALIAGTYGKGKVIASSFHPEYLPETYELFAGIIYAASGIRITPQIPVSGLRPLRVTYYAAAARDGHAQSIREFTALERCPELAVETDMKYELLGTDLLILPDAAESVGKKLFKANRIASLKKFMDRGGKVLAIGATWKIIPDHKNMYRIPAAGCLVKAAKKIAAE